MKPIYTEADYQQALARIETIFQAMPGALEFIALNKLTTLVQAYDAVHYPMPEPIEYTN